jgi:3-deoxy-manno-octulosonate cytidylyltransferase (CMP-KDO synthetase)
MQRALGVIPARYASTRFRGKLLAPLAGGTLLEEVWRKACEAERLERVIVATDDERIRRSCLGYGAEVMMTSADHPSGTDRVAEIVRNIGAEYGVIVNIQGDEPLVTGSSLDMLVAAFDTDQPPAMATLAEPCRSIEDLFDPNVVKIVVNADGRALYFSRSPIPFHRGNAACLATDFRPELAERKEPLAGYLAHQGIYAYGRQTILELTAMPASPLETSEGLEQLRALEAGYAIKIVPSDFMSIGVDTPADLERVEALLAQRRRVIHDS